MLFDIISFHLHPSWEPRPLIHPGLSPQENYEAYARCQAQCCNHDNEYHKPGLCRRVDAMSQWGQSDEGLAGLKTQRLDCEGGGE